MQVITRGRRYKVVVLAGQKLQASRLGRERSERYREVHQLVRFIAHRYYLRIGIRDAARLVLVFRHVVYDVLLHFLLVAGVRCVHGTDEVHLIVLELDVVPVDVDDIVRVVDAEDGVRRVPVDRVKFGAARRRRRRKRVQAEQQDDSTHGHTARPPPTVHCTALLASEWVPLGYLHLHDFPPMGSGE